MTGALSVCLSAAVPMYIHRIGAAGPTEVDFKEATDFASVLGEQGDVLLFGGKPGHAADLFNRLAKSIAVLSFLPGGVTLFGEHYDGRKICNQFQNKKEPHS